MYKIWQIFPLFKGKIRIANLLIFNKSKSRNFTIPNNLIFSVPNLTENVSLELFINGIYEEKYLKIISKFLPLNGVFIDVGANIGAISVLLAKMRPDISIHAFEAAPNVYKYLELNKEQNSLKNLFIYNLAIHSKDNIELPFYSPIALNGKGSFSPVFTQESTMVKTLSLDSFFTNNGIIPNLIKVDVEGYEALIFESMNNYISTSDACPILFEFVDWAEKLANFEIGAAQQVLISKKYELKDVTLNKTLTIQITEGSAMILAKK